MKPVKQSADNYLGQPRLRPPLKWAGGKRWLIPQLKPIWDKHKTCRLVEPLCGGLAVTLGLMPMRAQLNDVNSHLINFYHWLKRGLRVTSVNMSVRTIVEIVSEGQDQINTF